MNRKCSVVVLMLDSSATQATLQHREFQSTYIKGFISLQQACALLEMHSARTWNAPAPADARSKIPKDTYVLCPQP